MLGRREYGIVVALLLAAVLATGRVRSRLDEIAAPFRNSFRTMMYLPRGDALKIVAAGFDAPMADALFIKALVYYPQASKQTDFGDESKLYVYELFDVVTDLSPRFYRAYQTGALFLTASRSLEANRQGIKLLEKGIAVYDRLEAEGRPADVNIDPRWLFHSLLATTMDVNIQSWMRREGNAEGAAEARMEAGEHFRLAAASPGVPQYIVDAANGFGSVLKGQGDIEDARLAVLSVWAEMRDRAARRGEEKVAADLEERIVAANRELEAIVATRRVQALLSDAGRRYRAAKGRPAANVEELRRSGFARAIPQAWPLDETTGERDEMLALPDGTFKSRIIARWETLHHLDILLDSVIQHRRFHGVAPEELEELVRDGVLPAVPTPPLAELGQEYEYDKESGLTRSTHTELFEKMENGASHE